MAASRGTLAMRRLGVRLIEQRNPDDAIVLGDAMQQEGIDGLITGRSRPVMFRTAWQNRISNDGGLARITTQDEWDVLGRTQMRIPSPFFVQGYETIYNVGRFAAKPNEERWKAIWSMWVTPQRATYRALVGARLLPRSIRWHELRWADATHLPADVALSHRLYLERVLPKRKRPIDAYMFSVERRRPIDAYMFSVERRDEDNPRTWNQKFSDPPFR